MKKGIFCISIDIELLWGRKDLNYSAFIDRTKKERLIIKRLLSLFKKYQIPATWALVGKLYEKGDELWSGHDFIKWIQKDKLQEIASHSYSHEDISKISKGEAKKEFSFPKAKSFIFPRNHIAHLELLKKSGFQSYRLKDKSEFELLIPRIPPVANAKKRNGLVEIPSSIYFVSGRGVRQFLPQGLRFLKARLGINSAINQKKIFHLWFHPVDFADKTESLFSEFEKILKYADKKRKENKLEIKNMNQIFEEI